MDFDGVGHPSFHKPSGRFLQFKLLDECLRPFKKRTELVISSSWRFEYSPSELKSLLPKSMGELVVNVTGPAVIGSHARWKEIQAYVSAYGIKDYKILDDSRFEFPTTCPELILCDSRTGIKNREIEILESWLANK